MPHSIKRNLITTSLVAFVAVAAIFIVVFSADRAAHADTGPPDAMSVDMDTTGNDATTLGTREDCIVASAGDTITIDVTVEGIPAYTDNAPLGLIDPSDTGGTMAFSYDLTFNSSYLQVSSASHMLIGSNAGSSLFDISDLVPGTVSPWRGAALDISITTTPESGDGVLSRLTIGIDASTPAGSYNLILINHAISEPEGFFTPTATNNGRIVVGTTCDAPTPSPTGTPTPAPSPTPTPSGGLDAMSIDMDVTGNDATTLGSREDCIAASAGDTLTIDITAEGIAAYIDNAPLGLIDASDTGGMVAFSYVLNFNSSYLQVSSASHMLIVSNAGSNFFDASNPLPDAVSPWIGAGLDTSATSVPESGDGVFSRLTIGIDGSTPTGSYSLTLTDEAIGDPSSFFLPATTNNGRVVVGTTCAALTPTPTPPPPPGSGQGDVDCDNDVDSVDGLKILRHVAGLSVTQNVPCPEIGSVFASLFADIDCDDDVDSVDSLKVLLFVVDLSFSQNEPCPDIDGPPGSSSPPPCTVSCPEVFIDPAATTVPEGDTTTVSVMAQAPVVDLGAWTFDVHFDPSVLDATVCHEGSVGLNLCNGDFGPSTVRIAGADAGGASGEIEMARIRFMAIGAVGECSDVTIEVVTFTDPEGNDEAFSTTPGEVCVEAGPPATPTPTPGPGSASPNTVGIDHNGATVDINPGPRLIAPGTSGDVSLVVGAPVADLGAWNIDIHYDNTVVTIDTCDEGPVGLNLCLDTFTADTIRLVGADAVGASGTLLMATMHFTAIGSLGECSDLTLAVNQFADPEGNETSPAVFDGQICVSAEVPTPVPTGLPSPTPTPPPPATELVVGIDHNAGLPDINPGPAIAPPAGTATVAVVVENPTPSEIGAWNIDVHYDPSVVDAVACQPAPVGLSVCNKDFGVVTVRVVGVSVPGVTGTVKLADITFVAVGLSGQCGDLVTEVQQLANSEGAELDPAEVNGEVCIDGAACPAPPPVNDDFDAAIPAAGLPFFDVRDTRCAAPAFDDPSCIGSGHSVWYSYTPATDHRVSADTFGSSYDTTLSAYTGPRGALSQIKCNDDTGGLQSRIDFDVVAGETYHFMVGAFATGPGGDLQFSIREIVPLMVEVEIDPVGGVIARDGIAIVHGTVECSKPATADIFGSLSQRAGRVIIEGFFFQFSVPCNGTTSWSAEVPGDNGLFKGGHADASVEAFAFDFSEFASDDDSERVQLRGQSPPKDDQRCPRGGNDGFELGAVDTNDIPCWTVADGGPGGWCLQEGTSPPQGACFGSLSPVEAPPEGSQAAMTNQGGPGTHVLYRCGVLRSDVVSFQLYLNNQAGVFFSPGTLSSAGVSNQQFRADLVDPDALLLDPFTVDPGDVLMNLYQTMPGDPATSGYTEVVADVSAFGRDDVCLRFAEVDNQFFFNVGVDDVAIDLR